MAQANAASGNDTIVFDVGQTATIPARKMTISRSND
jgi:hypothetical protein